MPAPLQHQQCKFRWLLRRLRGACSPHPSPRPKSPHCQRQHGNQDGTDQRLRTSPHGALDQKCVRHTSTDDDDGRRGVRKAPDLPPNPQSLPKPGQDCRRNQRPHCHHAERRKRCRRGECQRVNHIGWAGDPQTANMNRNGDQQNRTGPAMNPAPGRHRQQGKKPGGQQRLQQQQGQRDHAGKSRRDVDRAAILKQLAARRHDHRRDDYHSKRCPDQGCPEDRHGQAGCKTKWALRLLSRRLPMTGRRNTVSKSPLS